jgi:hypothetical protein
MENTLQNKDVDVAPTINKGGAPLGNQNGKKSRLFYDQLRKELAQEDSIRLRKIAKKLVEAAEDGEPWAVKEIMDRVDGKAIQVTEMSGLDGGAIETLSSININLKKPE